MRFIRQNPFNERSIWSDSFNNLCTHTHAETKKETPFYPSVDILNAKADVVLHVELPGVKKDDISINIQDKVLTIEGERKYENEEKKDEYYRKEIKHGLFKRSFQLSEDVLTEEVNADFKDGILKLTLKKDNTKEEVKKITIN
jgi:HSP20 family protein